MTPQVASARSTEEKRRRLAQLILKNGAGGLKRSSTIPRRRTQGLAPLSFAQKRLWFLDRLVPGSAFYNVPAAIRMRTPFVIDIARATLNEIVRRHEVLRTTITLVDAEPMQVVSIVAEVPFKIVDLRSLDPVTREREALRYATEDARQPFDLSRDPMIRAGVVRLTDSELVFLLSMHHIASDGWSMGVFVQEFRQLYEAFLQHKSSPLPELPIQYADFAVWQQHRLASGELDAQLRYWTEKLANIPVLELPTDYPHRDVQGFEGETLYITIPERLTEQLEIFSRENSVTLFVTLAAGLNVLLHRYTGQDDIVFGEPVANRNRIELEPLIGFFVNSLVLRTDVSGDPTFRELVERTKNVVLEADANQDVPFEVLVEKLQPERTMGRNPLFQVSLQFFSGSDANVTTAVSPDVITVEKGTASLDLAFDLIRSDSGILARIEYSTELFRQHTIRRLATHYENLLREIVANPDLRASQVCMLSAEERSEVLSANVAASLKLAPFQHVHERFEERVSLWPDRIAVESGGVRLTYDELNRRANRLARKLRAGGVAAESVVAILLERSVDAVVAVLATWKAGGAYLPVDDAIPHDRVRELVRDAKPVIICTSGGRAQTAASFGVPVIDVWDDQPADDANLPPVTGRENLAYVIYTSGSTGTPKGVMVEHGALSRHLEWMQTEFPLTPEDRTLFKYSFSFDVSILEMFSPLLAGARVFVIDSDGPLDLRRMAKLIQDRAITVLDVVPSMLAALLDNPVFLANGSLRRVICGGEALPPELMNRFLARFHCEFVNMYGPTETTISATYWRNSHLSDKVFIGRTGTGPCSAYILDRYLNPLPEGIAGELYIGGHCVARGYLNRPDLTEERFVRDPFSRDPQARMYRTGDRCRMLPDGDIEFLGRMDEQVKVRGHRIELGEISSALSSSPLVKACAAALVGESGNEQLAAYVVPTQGEVELWPSVGEYFIYDELLYQVMTRDRVRTNAYRAAIARSVRGKVVVDVGTGADLVLARMCVEAGASRVYAIEMLDEAFGRASQLCTSLGLSDRVTLLHGDSRSVTLPEPADVCVSELIGTIGSSEGVIPVLNDARRLLKRSGEMIPYRCRTYVAAVSLPQQIIEHPEFTEIPRHYAERIFRETGRRFDLRVCLKNLSPSSLASSTAVFEDLVFNAAVPVEESTDFRLTITRDCRIDGLLLWIVLHPSHQETIDVLRSECSWLPVFLPVFPKSVTLQSGDIISGTASRLANRDEITPDYIIRGQVTRKDKSATEFYYESARNESRLGGNAFYDKLARSLESTVPRSSASIAGERTRVSDWAQIYEQLYGDDAPRDGEFDIVGWNSSYTGEPLSVEEMREQVESTTARIAALGGKRILEIGCGTGLLLLRLAGDCDRYVGTDFSHAVLERLRGNVERRGWSDVELWERCADDFSGIAPGEFDVVVLNSIIQYFPSIDYLLRVVDGALRALRSGGFLFIGDVRNLRLMPLLHGGIERLRASDRTTAGELRHRIERRGRQEVELLIDPDFFHAMPAHFEALAAISVQLRRGSHHNELTRFRYDAVLQVGGAATGGTPATLDWKDVGAVEVLRAYLEREKPPALRINNVPNARVLPEQQWLDAVYEAHADTSASRLEVNATEGVDPESLWTLAETLPYDIHLTWSDTTSEYDALFLPKGTLVMAPQPHARPKPWSAYANTPSGQSTQQDLAGSLRSHLRQRLPEYMIPSAFVSLEALPLTPSGKLNRRALPLPGPAQTLTDAYAPPESDLHRQILGIWTKILGFENIGIDSNFFTVGGHSLMATQVVSRLSDALKMEVPLRLMFEKPTVRGFAASVEELMAGPQCAAPPPIIAAQTNDLASVDPDKLSDEEVDDLLTRLLGNAGKS